MMRQVDHEKLVKQLRYWMLDWDYEEPLQYFEMKREEFQEKVLNYWAIMEVIDKIIEHPEADPFTTVENFRDRMDNYCCTAKTEEAKNIFVSLYEAATNVLDFLVCLIAVRR